MATEKVEDAEMADGAGEGPLFSLSYELTSLMVEDAASLAENGRIRNLSYTLSVAVLAVLVFGLTLPNANGAFAVVCAIAAAVLWAVASNSRRIPLDRMRRAGFETVGVPAEGRRCRVDVYRQTVSVEGPGGRREAYQLSELAHVRAGDDTCVMEFSGHRYAIVPRTSMSQNRYQGLVRFLKERRA